MGDDEVIHEAGRIIATEAATIALQESMRLVLVPVVEDVLGRITDQVTALDDRLTQLEHEGRQ